MRLSAFLVLTILVSLVLAIPAPAADLQAGWYANISNVTVYRDAGPPLGIISRATGYFYRTLPGRYGPFQVTDGAYHSYSERLAFLPTAVNANPSDGLLMPLSFGMTIGEPIAYVQISWSTNYDPIQMHLEIWRTRSNGQQELVWFQPVGGRKYGSAAVLYDTVLEGPYFIKVAVAPPGGFSDLSPPDITIQSPRQYDRCYNHDNEPIPITFVVNDYGTGNAEVNVMLDDQPFAGRVDYTEFPGNLLEATSEIDVSGLENGRHTLKVTARDYAGNTGVQSVTFVLQHLDGAIVGWGNYYYDQSIQPPGLADVVAISAGGTHSLALKSDGTVASWGCLTVGYQRGALATPQWLTDVVAVAASGHGGLSPPSEHSLALRSDDTVIGWGYDYNGQATPPQGLTNAIAISAGGQHNLALKSDGTVIGWGANYSGEATPPYGLMNATAISAGYGYSLALKSDGTVVNWGANYLGRMTPPQGLANVIAISAGFTHCLALRSDCTVVAWGNNNFGQATVPPGLTDVIAISAGMWQSLALKSDGTVVGWGSNLNGEAIPPAGLTNVVAISTGNQYSLALRDITPPSIGVQSPVDGQTYFNTDGPIPVGFIVEDDFDLQPKVTLTLDGEPFSGSEIAVSDLPFGDHTLHVTAQDRFGNTSTRDAVFKVTPKPMLFTINDLNIDWRRDARRPKADRFRVSGEFSLPAGYSPSRLSKEVVVLIEVGGHNGTDTVLGKAKGPGLHWAYVRRKYDLPIGFNMDMRKLKIEWNKRGDKPNTFKLDSDLSAGIFNDDSRIVTVSMLLPVVSGGDLAGTETVTCNSDKHGWEYHR